MHSILHVILSVFFTQESARYFLLLADILALLSAPSVLLQRSGRPIAAISWLLAIFALPYLGVALWWTIGRNYLQRALKKRINRSEEFFQWLTFQSDTIVAAPDQFAQILPVASRLPDRRSSIYTPTSGNSIHLLKDGKDAFEQLEQALNKAQSTIYIMMYYWAIDRTGLEIKNIIVKALKRGVEVYILVDGAGSSSFIKHFMQPLILSGASIRIFHPLLFQLLTPTFNFRNHRKLIIIDHELAFTGGMNLADEYKYSWLDLMMLLRGPCVAQLQEIFFDDWYSACHENIAYDSVYQKTESITKKCGGASCAIISSGPDTVENWTHDILFLCLSSAKNEILLTTPYFIPSQAIIAALRAASLRGVMVKVLLPHKNDIRIVQFASRTYYRLLLEAGVRILEYHPAFIHRKSLVIDEELSLIGSANVDSRSFKLNFELSCLVRDKSIGLELKELFCNNLLQAEEVHLHNLKKDTLFRNLVESTTHLLSPLL